MQSPATTKCPLELEIAKTVVLPRLRDIAKSNPPRSKSHMYDTWVEKWGPLSRSRFDMWLDMLEISFIKIVVVDGLEESDDQTDLNEARSRTAEAVAKPFNREGMRFDNEEDED